MEESGPGVARLLAEVRRIEVASRRLATDVMSGGWHSVFRGAGLAFDTVREYVEGDDPRTVDWNVTARVGRPFVKTYVEERDLTALFLLDVSPSMSGGFASESARTTAARVVACLAVSAVRNGDRAGLVAFAGDPSGGEPSGGEPSGGEPSGGEPSGGEPSGGEVVCFVPPRRGLSHALRIVRDSLALGTTVPGTNLPLRSGPAAALRLVSRAVRKRSIVFLVSDFLWPLDPKALAPAARRHDVVAVRLLLPELEPPPSGLMRLRDPETGGEALVDWSRSRTRAAYRTRVAEWRAETERTLAKARVDLLDVPVPRIPSPDSVAGPLLRFFRMRELRGTKR